MKRLHSGVRIHGAQDDSAGLATLNRLDAQRREVQRVRGNADQVVSLAQTSHSAYQDVMQHLYELRTLVLRSAQPSHRTQDREQLQAEVQDALDEIDRIGQRSFNSMKLFGVQRQFYTQVGLFTEERSVTSLTTNTLSSAQLGQLSTARSTKSVDTGEALADGELTITSATSDPVSIRGTHDADDTRSTERRSASAIAKAHAINQTTHLHQVTAIAEETVVTSDEVQSVALDQSNLIAINGYVINGVTVQAHDADHALRNAINHLSDQTGVIASYDEAQRLTLTAQDGRNISIIATGNATLTGLSTGVTGGRLRLFSDQAFTLRVEQSSVNRALGVVLKEPIIEIADGARALTDLGGQSGVSANLNADFELNGVGIGQVNAIDPRDDHDFNLKTTGDLLTFSGNHGGLRSLTLRQTLSAHQQVSVALNVTAFDAKGAHYWDGVSQTEVTTHTGHPLEDPDDRSNENLLLQTSVDGGQTWQTEDRIVDVLTIYRGGNTHELLAAADPAGDSEQEQLERARYHFTVSKPQDYQLRIAQLSNTGSLGHGDYDHYAIVFGSISLMEPNEPIEGVFGLGSGGGLEDLDLSKSQDQPVYTDIYLHMIDRAIAEISENQVNMGILQREMEMGLRALSDQHFQLSLASSRIRDADVALESAELSRQQIIQRASASMLSQASVDRNVTLQLLRKH